jgi:hypothetical protein
LLQKRFYNLGQSTGFDLQFVFIGQKHRIT